MTQVEPVLVSKASYFKAETKKWIEGTFELRQHYLQFLRNDETLYTLPLSSISSLEKRNSSFVYPSICILAGKDKIWFASFPNRDAVYNMIELFWREALLSKPTYRNISSPKAGTSNLGKELISILHESESTLVEAANALVSQGRQLDESQMTVADINSDLNVAEKFVRNMSFTQAITKIKTSDSSSEQTVKETVKPACYRVTFSFSDEPKSNKNWEKGKLTVSDEVILIDENLDQRFHIQSDKMEKILVLSPWEFRLEYPSDWTSKYCHIICPQLSRLLLFLNYFPQLKNKVEIENDIQGPSGFSAVPKNKAEIKNTHVTSGLTTSTFPCTPELSSLTSKKVTHNSSTEKLETLSADVISDEDMEEISSMITNLKTLAADVKREQQSQLEKIESLVTDVENTELRINADNKKIKKIT